MTLSWILWVLIGFAFGAVVGILCGIYIADNYWKNKMCPFCDHDYQKYLERKQYKQGKGSEQGEEPRD